MVAAAPAAFEALETAEKACDAAEDRLRAAAPAALDAYEAVIAAAAQLEGMTPGSMNAWVSTRAAGRRTGFGEWEGVGVGIEAARFRLQAAAPAALEALETAQAARALAEDRLRIAAPMEWEASEAAMEAGKPALTRLWAAAPAEYEALQAALAVREQAADRLPPRLDAVNAAADAAEALRFQLRTAAPVEVLDWSATFPIYISVERP